MCGMKLLVRFQTSTTVEIWGRLKKFHTTRRRAFDYLSTLGLKLNHASKRGPGIIYAYPIYDNIISVVFSAIHLDVLWLSL